MKINKGESFLKDNKDLKTINKQMHSQSKQPREKYTKKQKLKEEEFPCYNKLEKGNNNNKEKRLNKCTKEDNKKE
jgi:hypothetical protein